MDTVNSLHQNFRKKQSELIEPNSTRRRFLALGTTSLLLAGFGGSRMVLGKDPVDFARPDALDVSLTKEIVSAAHTRPEEVKRLLDAHPTLVNATWDWGSGDYETPLGAASHMGRRDVAELLVDAGARKDMFYFAMMGGEQVIKSVVASDENVVNVLGPHGLSLLYHVALSGRVPLAEFLLGNGAVVSSLELNASVRIAKDYAMTAWLLENGAQYADEPGIGGKTLIESANEANRPDIADLLKQSLG